MKKILHIILCGLLLAGIASADIINQSGPTRNFSIILSEILNDTTVPFDAIGAGTISFYITPPTGGVVTFEVSYDNINFEAVSIRGVTDDTWNSTIDTVGNFIGSIASAKKFRFKTTTAGSAPGLAEGRVSDLVTILEGVEFGAPPHKFGYVPIHIDGNFTTTQTATVLFAADADKYSVITDLTLVASGSTDCNLKIFDETDATGNYIFRGGVEVATNNNFIFSHSYLTPYVASAKGNSWKLTTDAGCDVEIIMHGYQY